MSLTSVLRGYFGNQHIVLLSCPLQLLFKPLLGQLLLLQKTTILPHYRMVFKTLKQIYQF